MKNLIKSAIVKSAHRLVDVACDVDHAVFRVVKASGILQATCDLVYRGFGAPYAPPVFPPAEMIRRQMRAQRRCSHALIDCVARVEGSEEELAAAGGDFMHLSVEAFKWGLDEGAKLRAHMDQASAAQALLQHAA